MTSSYKQVAVVAEIGVIDGAWPGFLSQPVIRESPLGGYDLQAELDGEWTRGATRSACGVTDVSRIIRKRNELL